MAGMGTLLFVLTEDWFFLSHFQPMARAAAAAGLRVVVAARLGSAAEKIRSLGYRVAPIEIGRDKLDPVGVATSALALRKVLASENPAIVHAIALPAVVATALATFPATSRRQVILAPTGLGSLWIDENVPSHIARTAVQSLLSATARRRDVHFLFENPEDPREFGLDPADGAKVTIVGGAGVSASDFVHMPLAEPPPLRVAVVSRMTEAKGIEPAVEAVRRLRAMRYDIHLDLYGSPDERNRRSIPTEVLAGWAREDGIAWHGHIDDVRTIWAKTHVALLLSWREGLPRALVEAMACGRPVVTTDVTGCRTLVRDGVEGLLVPRDSVDATVSALQLLYEEPERRVAMGIAARQRFESGYTDVQVERTVATLYKSLMAKSEALPERS